MNTRRIVWSIVGLLSVSVTALGGPVTVFTDLEAFRAAAGPLVEIDFTTLPDGSPAPLFVPVQVTPEFNYPDFGVTFSSHEPELLLMGHVQGGATLFAVSKSGIRNWIEADFEPPVYAVAVNTGAVLSVFDLDSNLLAQSPSAGFIGFVSDTPIGLGMIDNNSNGAAITSILFQPVPEPATLLLLGAGAFFVARRRWAHKT